MNQTIINNKSGVQKWIEVSEREKEMQLGVSIRNPDLIQHLHNETVASSAELNWAMAPSPISFSHFP